MILVTRGGFTGIALCVSWLLLSCALGDEANDLLFYCRFDGNAEPTFARGDPGVRHSLPPLFQEGLRGQALLIGGQGDGGTPRRTESPHNACYRPEKNLDVTQGSISFWLKPLDWDGSTKGFNVLFYTWAGRNYFQIYKYWSDDRLLFLRGEQVKWTSVDFKIRDWRPGQWHHLVATWSPAELRLFVDGARVCTRRVRFPLDNPAPVEPFSVGPSGAWTKAFIGRSLVDELRVYRRPLGDEEVIRLYRQDSAKAEFGAGLITLGEKTPTLDGILHDFEYAFAGSGFYDLKGLVTGRQGRYFLSYDRSNLYVAVQSTLDRRRAERVEVLLAPPRAEMPVYRFAFTPAGVAQGGEAVRVANAVSGNTWTLEAAIPFSALGLAGPPDGQRWRVNIGRVLDSPAEVLSIAPVRGSLDDRSQFLSLAFRPDAPLLRIASWIDLERRQSATDVSVRSPNRRSEIRLDSISDTTQDYGVRSHSVPLFSQGKSTPYRSPVWTLQHDFSLSESRIVERLDGKDTTLYLKRTIYEDPAPLKTLFLYTQARKRLFVSALRRADGKIQARFVRPDGTCVFQAHQAIPANATYFQALFDLDFGKLTPGDYTVKIDYVAPDGKATETWEQAYRIPGKDAPEFRPYVDNEAGKVPAPWTALKSGHEKVEMWGRTYDFSKGFLFSSLVSQGKEILAGPAALRMDGQTLVPAQPAEVTKVAGDDMLAEWKKRADLGRLQVESRIRTHFDGYCEIAMTLEPGSGARQMAALSLDIPLRGEAATLVRDSKHCTVVGSKSGAVGPYWCQDLTGGTFLWVGNNQVGFNWLAPNLENWKCTKTAKTVEVVREGSTAILRFNLIDTPLKLDAPRTIRFGFTLTPSRPLDRKILRMRNHKDLQMWCQPWKYFAYPDYDTADRKEIERAGEGVKEVFLYFGDGLTSPFSPEWAWWEEEWRDFRGGARTFGEWTGDFLEPSVRNRCCYVEATGKTYFNFMQNKRHAFFERATTPLTPKARNYYFDTGASTKDSYREQALNVYRMIRRTGPEAKIWAHQGLLRVMPMQHFADILCGGEALGSMVSRDGNYFSQLTPEMFRATYSPYLWGMKMVFLDMTVRSLAESHPDRLVVFRLTDAETRRPLLHSYGYCVVHDVDIDDSYRQSKPLREAIWAAQDTLGWDEHVVFHPYWENDAVRLTSPASSRIMASAYTKGGRMLLAVLNDTDREQNVTLELDLERLGVIAGLKGRDVWEPEKTYLLSKTWNDTIPPRGFRLVPMTADK